MTLDTGFGFPVSSYVEPVSVVEAGISDEPLVCLALNASWVPYVCGSLMQLVQPSTWDTLDTGVLQTIIGKATDLIALVSNATGCVSLLFRLSDSCVLQSSSDGGTTWVDVSGWATQFPLCVAAIATSAVVLRELRFQDCELQVSLDAGETWSAVSGWDDNFAACVTGIIPPPSNPQSLDNFNLACAIADYIAQKVIHDALTKLLDGISSAIGPLATVAGISGALVFLEVLLPIEAIALDGLYALYEYVNSGNVSAYTDAVDDPALFAAIKCAIYGAIAAEGKITTSNCAGVVTAVAAVDYAPSSVIIPGIAAFLSSLGCDGLIRLQIPGGLTTGADCSTCSGSWCMVADFAVSSSHFFASTANYVPGVGWGSVSGGGAGDGLQIEIVDYLPSGSIVDSIEIFGSAAGTDDADHRAAFNDSTFDEILRLPTGTGAFDSFFAVADTDSWAHLNITLSNHPGVDAGPNVNVITKVIWRGHGVIPTLLPPC
jgi:hypothetical protein